MLPIDTEAIKLNMVGSKSLKLLRTGKLRHQIPLRINASRFKQVSYSYFV